MRRKLAPKLALGMFIGLESTALEKEATLQGWIFEREANPTALANSPLPPLFILSPEYDLYARTANQQIPICFPLNGKWR